MADPTVVKDVYILVGRYEEASRMIFRELKSINNKLETLEETNQEDHEEIKKCITTLENVTTTNATKIKVLEDTGVPKKTNQKIDASLILGLLNTLATIVKSFLGIP